MGDRSRGNTVGSRTQRFSSEQAAYLAGFLDGDGCIAVNYEKNAECRLGIRVRIRVSFTQHRGRRKVLDRLREWIGSGVIAEYDGNGMAEYVIRDQTVVEDLLLSIQRFLVVKEPHADAALEILRLKKGGYSTESLEQMRKLAEFIRQLNRYPKRKSLDPVTTEA
jgi:hypothetical protein